MTEKAFIALGSNVDSPRQQVERAVQAIRLLPSCKLIKVSPFYETAPMGYAEQDPFINAVVLIETDLSPLGLLAYLQDIERAQGRVREFKNGPRTIDCDLVLFGSRVLNLPELILPHPGLMFRDFVLRPLLDIAPDCALPDGQLLSDVLNEVEETFVF
ncbi:MAG: 2-amino-4-hydroxy-6-hydroxymethyldihydropteridine diphosphokinase [Gammaproteobacteria bacterium]